MFCSSSRHQSLQLVTSAQAKIFEAATACTRKAFWCRLANWLFVATMAATNIYRPMFQIASHATRQRYFHSAPSLMKARAAKSPTVRRNEREGRSHSRGESTAKSLEQIEETLPSAALLTAFGIKKKSAISYIEFLRQYQIHAEGNPDWIKKLCESNCWLLSSNLLLLLTCSRR